MIVYMILNGKWHLTGYSLHDTVSFFEQVNTILLFGLKQTFCSCV